jgi:hypothetical protein
MPRGIHSWQSKNCFITVMTRLNRLTYLDMRKNITYKIW